MTYFLSPSRQGAMFYLSFLGAMGMFIPFLNVYFQQELGFNGRQIGLLAMAAPLMTLTIVVPVSRLADRRRWRIAIIVAALGGLGAMMFVLRLPQSFPLVIPSWMFTAMFLTIVMPLSDSVISRMALHHNLNFGAMRLWGSVGFALASAVCGALWTRVGFERMFLVVGGALFLVSLLASRMKEAPVQDEQQQHPPIWGIRKDLGLVVLLISTFFAGVSFNLSTIFDGIYMSSLGGSGLLIGMIFSMSAGGELPMMYYRDKIAGHLNGSKTFLLAYGLLLAAYLGYAAAWHPWMLLLTALVKGFSFGLFLSSAIPFISERVPESLSSTVQSLFNVSLFGLAPLLAAPLGGEIYERFGPRAIFVCGSLFALGATTFMLFAIARGIFTETHSQDAYLPN